ncbi:MAG: GIY-YIG nuclease family protein [Desulfobacterota bacterium]|nr:GIY-YIG nuclease family protein [Thermodesulfobacteriota bacterium]
MNLWVYILQSETTGRYYCGQTSNLQRRLLQHNDPQYHLSKTTKRLQGPWKLLWSQECPNQTVNLPRRLLQSQDLIFPSQKTCSKVF